jgi:hypothetical protein
MVLYSIIVATNNKKQASNAIASTDLQNLEILISKSG